MTTRDPRHPREPVWANRSDGGRDGGREPTQSLTVDPDEYDDDDGDDSDEQEDSSSLARGTHEAQHDRDSHTKIESPAAQRRTPVPPEPRNSPKPEPRNSPKPPRKSSKRRQAPVQRGDEPKDYLGTMLGAYRV